MPPLRTSILACEQTYSAMRVTEANDRVDVLVIVDV